MANLNGSKQEPNPVLIRETVNGYEIVQGHLRLEAIKSLYPELTINEAVEKGLIEVMSPDREK